MATVRQHKIFHQGLRDFLVEMDIDPTRKNTEMVKKMFKRYLNVNSVASLSDSDYSRVISAVFMLMSREFGKEIPAYEAEKTMKEILNEE